MYQAIKTRFAYFIEDILQLELSKGRALDIFGTKISCHFYTLCPLYRFHLLLCKLFLDVFVVAEIYLGADNQTGHSWAVVVDLREPLLTNILERSR